MHFVVLEDLFDEENPSADEKNYLCKEVENVRIVRMA
jgi:hypothetical protein